MTFRQEMQDRLEANGLWPQEAKAVLESLEKDEKNSMHRRWQDRVDGYPPQLLTAVWMNVRREAIDYLKKTAPRHFALPILEGE